MEPTDEELREEITRALDVVRSVGRELDELIEELPASRTGRGLGNLIGRPDNGS